MNRHAQDRPQCKVYRPDLRSHALGAATLALAMTLSTTALAQNTFFAPCAQWKTFEEAGLGETLNATGEINSLISFDLDGPGPQGDTLIATLTATTLDDGPAPDAMRWNGAAWVPFAVLPGKASNLRFWIVEALDGSGKVLYATDSVVTT
ncbi:MAG: hypothetical protein K2X32_15085, partial [Phycisphaerales bacterium]|nr:hypothetical protein [Phycisphaerales bacterium]